MDSNNHFDNNPSLICCVRWVIHDDKLTWYKYFPHILTNPKDRFAPTERGSFFKVLACEGGICGETGCQDGLPKPLSKATIRYAKPSRWLIVRDRRGSADVVSGDGVRKSCLPPGDAINTGEQMDALNSLHRQDFLPSNSDIETTAIRIRRALAASDVNARLPGHDRGSHHRSQEHTADSSRTDSIRLLLYTLAIMFQSLSFDWITESWMMKYMTMVKASTDARPTNIKHGRGVWTFMFLQVSATLSSPRKFSLPKKSSSHLFFGHIKWIN